MKSLRRFISAPAVYALGSAAVLLLFFELWRLILLIFCRDMAAPIPAGTLLKSFLIGARFDYRIVSIIVLPLFLIATLPGLDISRRRAARKINLVLLSIAAGVTFFIHLVDLEFFNFFNSRLNGSVLLWQDTPGDSLSLIWDTYPVIRYLLFYLVILAAFIFIIRRLLNRVVVPMGRTPLWLNLIYIPIVAAVLVLGIYGRIYQVAPMRWGMAYFSHYDFANQLTLNPTYTFMRDILYDAHNRSTLAEMVDKIRLPEAEAITRQMLGAPPPDKQPDQRMMRPVRPAIVNDNPPNVIVIIMESFAASKIGCLKSEYPYDLTPHFDSLAQKGLLFTNFYSAGTHTCSGLFTTLYGSPHLFGKILMKQVGGHASFHGLPSILRRHGYRTIFFTTQDPHFDNMQGFLMAHGMMDVYSVFDYDQSQVLSWLGVPDHVMYDYAFDKLTQHVRNSDKPFFATLLTGSNHGPWFVPDVPFNPLPDSIDRYKEYNALKYADWALGRIVNRILDDSAFANTLVIVTADNGYKYNLTTDLDLSLLEIPLLIIDTDRAAVEPGRNDRLGCQLDILPTVMGRTRLDYDNYSFGVDLLDTLTPVHDFVFASRWYQVGFIQDGYYTVMRLNGAPPSLFAVSDKAVDLAETRPDLLDTYSRRLRSVYQSAFDNSGRPLPRYPVEPGL